MPGPFGIEVPAAGDWLEPEVLLVPLVAFDARCYRLGYGGGFYDRTIARPARPRRGARATASPMPASGSTAVPHEPTDAPLDGGRSPRRGCCCPPDARRLPARAFAD